MACDGPRLEDRVDAVERDEVDAQWRHQVLEGDLKPRKALGISSSIGKEQTDVEVGAVAVDLLTRQAEKPVVGARAHEINGEHGVVVTQVL